MNKAILILAAATAISSIACMHLVRELREERALAESLQSRVAELERARVQLASRPSPFSAVPSEPPTAPAEPPTAEPPSPAPTQTQPRAKLAAAGPFDRTERLREHLKRQREMLQDPEYREAMRAQQRLGLLSTYPNLGSELELTQVEVDRLLDLLAEQRMRDMETQDNFLLAQNATESSIREAQRIAEQRQQQQQIEVEALLGPTKYQHWQEYQATLGQRHRTASIQSSLAMAGTPLNAQQSETLLSALVEEQRRQQATALASGGASAMAMAGSGSAAEEEWLKSRERSQERLIASLQSTLSAEQISHLRALFEREIEMHRAHVKLRQAQGGDQSSNIFFSGAAAPAAVGSWSMHPIEARAEEAPAE